MRASTAGAAGVGPEFFDKELTGFAIDSRAVTPGALFFALSPADYPGHFFTAPPAEDGHRFIPQAFAQGAAAAVARREHVEAIPELQGLRDRLLYVENVIEALQSLARGVIDNWGRPVVGVTGSAGKTTAKDLTAHVLAHAGRRVLKTQKNFNNELGLPLSILQMVTANSSPADYDVAVLEYGQSLLGEIAGLCRIAPPDVAVVLNVAPVHLEFFASVEEIAQGKGQLVENLKPGGTAILNADDERVIAMRSKHAGRAVTFGLERAADVTAADVEPARFGLTRFRLRTPTGEAAAELPLPGRHNLLNALAAASVAACFGLSAEEIADGLRTARPSEMRGEVLDFAAGFGVVDDSYNSNPRSLLSMVRALVEGSRGGDPGRRPLRTLVVAGEMLELGDEGARMHREAGREIAGLGVDVLWGVRGLAAELVGGAREAGMARERARFFPDADEAAAALLDEVRAGDLVLIKGSRGVRTDRIVSLLRERYPLRRQR